MIQFAVATALAAPALDGHGELRVVETLPSAWTIDAAGAEPGWGPVVDTRARLGGTIEVGDARLDAEADFFDGQLFGDTWDLSPLDERDRHLHGARSTEGFVPRIARLGVRLPWLDLEAGLATSQWGLGLVANDGDRDPLFGRSDFGDTALRLRLATAPFRRGGERFPLYVIAAGDRVVADDLARWSEGDDAWQAVLAALYVGDRKRADGSPATRRGGLYGVWRDQRDDAGLVTRAGVIDGYADGVFDAADTQVRLAAEFAVIAGRTEVARTYDHPEGLAVQSAGLVVQGEWSDGSRRRAVHLRAALATGDPSSDDASVNNFRFDRDYDVGMVLFDEVLADIDLGAWQLATDPDIAARPPAGVDALVAEGAFQQAVALQPVGVLAPLPWLELRAGLVFAWSTAPIAQSFYSFRAGGVPTNHLDRASGGRYLGTEVDWAIALREAHFTGTVVPGLSVQGGHASLSESLSGGVDRVDHVLVSGRLTF